jgi:hypothetical protein
VTVSGREMQVRDRKQPKTSETDSISAFSSLPRLFTFCAPARSRICTVIPSLAMDTATPELTPEAVSQSEKRRERKKLKHEAKRSDQPAPPQPDNSRFLARSWIKLPEVNDNLIQRRARVMTWNVCPTVLVLTFRSELNMKSSC